MKKTYIIVSIVGVITTVVLVLSLFFDLPGIVNCSGKAGVNTRLSDSFSSDKIATLAERARSLGYDVHHQDDEIEIRKNVGSKYSRRLSFYPPQEGRMYWRSNLSVSSGYCKYKDPVIQHDARILLNDLEIVSHIFEKTRFSKFHFAPGSWIPLSLIPSFSF
ncbi:MAG TPA: hypothetical protein PKD79_02550 [Candidatus Doudnabacteria bacterium]|nr:hypothetical protein [Candidatus Doudnabacteria bacterium]